MSEHPPAEDPHVRTARTKRERTRRSLLAAAEQLFADRGWNATKFEDIASAANVSVATAYNHFNSKHVLIAEIVGRLLQPRLDAAERTLHNEKPIMGALVAHILDLVALFKDEAALTVPFVYAVHDYTTRAGGPPDPADRQDPRNLAPVPAMLIKLVDAGQRTNVLRPYPPAAETATQITNLMLLRTHTRPDESSGETVELLLTFLFGVLRPDLLVDAGFTGRPFQQAPGRAPAPMPPSLGAHAQHED